MITTNEPVKIFQMNDCDWYAAHSKEEAVERAKQDYGPIEEEIWEDCRELSDEEMNTHNYWDSDNTVAGDPEHWRCPCGYRFTHATMVNRWTGERWEHLHEDGALVPMECVSRVPFVIQLGRHVAEGLPVPGLFASTEI